ncbi:MAG: 2Fe-2S iron-sulfur cluster-binding protein [Archangium sp.]
MPRISPLASPVTIELEGEQFQARAGEPVAAALLAKGETIFSRSPKYHRPRGPFCMTGSCAHCLMRVDGVPNVPTCRVPVKAGMRIERQNAMPDARLDVFRANDFVFRDWFNHHEFMAGVPIIEKVLQKIARQLAGLGVLPDKAAPDRPPAVIEKLGTVIVGAGAAGLSAAKELSARGVAFTLFEREAEVGGRLISAAETGQPAPWNAPARCEAEVVGLFADDGAPFLAVIEKQQLHLVFYETLILAMGGHPILPTFPNNDLPGVMAGRAVSALIRRHGVLAGATIACCGEPNEARALAELIKGVGGVPVAVGEEVVRAHGLREVTAVTTDKRKIDCDVIAVCSPLSPAFELARAAGAKVVWNSHSRCFTVETDAVGRTARLNVYVIGEMRGPMSSAAAAEQGLATADHLCPPGGKP